MGKVLNNIFGVCSLLGLVITIATLVITLNQIELIGTKDVIYANLASIYKVLGISIISLILIFLTQSFLYDKNISRLQYQLGSLPLENENLKKLTNHYIRINRNTTNSFHNICHSYRYISILLRDLAIKLRKEEGEISEDECRKVCNAFDKFTISLLSNITSTFDVITGDECATCIKIVKNNKVKTLYRDPISYRTRKKSDFTQDGKLFVYEIGNNYAFNLIADKNSKETFFACNDLSAHDRYGNINTEWNKLYNATIVVPIQANLTGNKRDREVHLLGFLCCDNMSGGFENREAKDFISSIGDILFNLLQLYDRFVQLAISKGINNETLLEYNYWNEG